MLSTSLTKGLSSALGRGFVAKRLTQPLQRWFSKRPDPPPNPAIEEYIDYKTLNGPNIESIKRLGEEFDKYFVRKPKVLIIGTDVSAMISALSFHAQGTNADVLDVGQHMDKSFDTKFHPTIIPLNGMQVLSDLNLSEVVKANGVVLNAYRRFDGAGNVLAEIPYKSMGQQHRSSTVGIVQRDFERLLQEEALARKLEIHQRVSINSLEVLPSWNPDQTEEPGFEPTKVSWTSEKSNISKTEQYDIVIASDGANSFMRSHFAKDDYRRLPVAQYFQAIIPRPADFLVDEYQEVWTGYNRIGIIPVSHDRNQVGVYGIVPLSDTTSFSYMESEISSKDFIERFKFNDSPLWRMIKSVVETHNVSFRSGITYEGRLKSLPPAIGRFVFTGPAAISISQPFFGHDIGYYITSAYKLANDTCQATIPVDWAIVKYLKSYRDAIDLSSTASGDLLRFLPTWMPRMASGFVLRLGQSSSAIRNRELELMGMKESFQNQMDSRGLNVLRSMKVAWMNFKPEEKHSLVQESVRAKSVLEKRLSESLKSHYLHHMAKYGKESEAPKTSTTTPKAEQQQRPIMPTTPLSAQETQIWEKINKDLKKWEDDVIAKAQKRK